MPRPPRHPSDAPFERAESIGYLVNELARAFARSLMHRLTGHGIALGQFPLLLVLWEEEGLTQSEIARRLDIEQPTVANTLKRMERDGLVVTAPDPNHGRQVLISLTDKARALKIPLTDEAQAVNRRAAATLSPQEVADFIRTLEQMRAALAPDEA